MDGWDPMKEAYQNKNFNSYKEGVGRDLSRSSQSSDGIQLLVQNIAPSLGKEGFYNMFAEYGRVTRHKLICSTEDKCKASHGYITMEKLEDAQAAISHLDKTRIGQFLLKVSPALTNEERERRRRVQKEEETMMASIRKDNAAKNEARFHQINASVNSSQENDFSRMREQTAQRQNASGMGSGSSDWHSEFQESHKGARAEPNQPFNNRYMAEREDFLHHAHENTNQNAHYWAKAEPKHSFNNRHVAEEVDFHHHAREDTDQNTACGIGVHKHQLYVHPRSLHGNYPGVGRDNFALPPRTQAQKFASPPQNTQITMMKICVYCYKEDCSYLCSRCKMYYCSTECQKNDWPKHKSKCAFISLLASDGNGGRAEHSNHIENDIDMYYTTDALTDRQMENTSRSARGFDSDSNEGRTKERKDKPQQVNNSRFLSNTGKVEHNMKNINQTASGRQSNDRAMIGQHQNGNRDYNGSMNSKKPNSQRLQNEKTVMDSSIPQPPENSNKTYQRKEGKKPFCQRSKDKVSGHSNESQFKNKRSGVSNGDSEMDKRYQTKGLKENNEERQETQNEPSGKVPDLGNKNRKAAIARDSNPKTEEAGNQSYGNKSRAAEIARDSNPKPEEARSQSYVITELSLPVGAKGQGYITHFESPFKFWLCLEEFLEPFAEMTLLMMKELSQGCAGAPTLCKVGETYGLKHSEEWRRVTVKSVSGQQVMTFYADYGSTTTARSEDLRPLSVDVLQLPAQALCCSLSNLKPLGSTVWSEAATRFVKDWLGEPESKIIHFEVVFKKESYYAMNISINNESLSEVLLSKKMAEHVNHQAGLQFLIKDGYQEVPRLMANSMASKIDGVKQGDVLSVMITDFVSAEKIFALDDTSKSVLDDLASSLQSEYKDIIDSYRPICGELVAAKFSVDENWYRAEVVNMDGDSCSLFYVDYGNSEIQTAQNIRPIINKQLINVPKQALLCSWFILNSSNVDFNNINKILEKYLPASISCEGKFSLLVKGKIKDTLMVEFITAQGLPLSEILTPDLKSASNNKELNFTNESHSSSTTTQQPVQKIDSMTLSDLGTETLPKTLGETVSVIVSYVESPAEFYVRLSSTQDLFKIMMKELNSSVQLSLPLPAPSVGCLAAVLYDKDRVWYRVMVEKIRGTQCQVYFIDYGNREEFKLSGLKALQDSACHLPAQAIRCCLKDKLKNPSEASVLKFKQQLESKPVDVKICGSNETGFFVQVFQDGADSASNLTKKISNMQLMSPLKLSPKIKKLDLSISSETLPATGETVAAEVSHVDSLSKFFICRKCENLQLELALVMQTLNEHAESLPPLEYPIVGSVCAAQFSKDSLWYRARVVEICSQTTCVVYFVDYGNSEETRMSDLRQIDSTMTMLPGQAIQCCLLGYESELSSEHAVKNVSGMAADLMQQLEAELLNKSVGVRVVDKKQDTWIIRLENEDGECIGISSPQLQTPRLSDLVFVTPPEKDFDAVISSVSSPTEFYCQKLDMKLEEELGALSESLRDDVSKLSASVCCDPVVGNVYTSMFVGTWYRCVVEKITGSSVLIRYIDYGNTEEISASCLKPLKPERLAVPVKLMKCKLYGVAHMEENWSDKGVVPFLEILQQQMVHVVIKAVEEDTFLVSVSTSDGDMAEYLAKNGAVQLSKGTLSQNEEKSPLPTPVTSIQQMCSTEKEDDDDDEYNEESIQRQIRELQLQLQQFQLKKKSKQ